MLVSHNQGLERSEARFECTSQDYDRGRVSVQRSRPTLMPDDARQPRQIRLETIHSLRYCVETHISPPLM